MATINELLEMMAAHGGKIVSTAALDVDDIRQAEASGRMVVDEKGLGYVWEPEVKGFPVTDEEVEQFERWFPLDIALPEGVADRLWQSIHEGMDGESDCKDRERHNNDVVFLGSCSVCGGRMRV